ncbi:MAG: hypothetical protein E6K70_18455 [Planctomycetota bacterium]|nr:MAG: hypothetical protein E6K70_18455 [Planctomycetota bacterium]
MTKVVAWQASLDRSQVLDQAVQALASGQLVAFPTETVYGVAASAQSEEGVERLRTGKGRPEGKPLTLALASVAEALAWLPQMSRLGRRLARRCWPGPCTLVFGEGIEEALAGLPEGVRPGHGATGEPAGPDQRQSQRRAGRHDGRGSGRSPGRRAGPGD